MADDNWIIKSAEIADERQLERASKDLSDGQKACLEENWPGKEGPNAGSATAPAAGPASIVSN
jgi:hypothetical protein